MKLFRKLRQDLIENSKVKKYLLYAIGEIFLVMIGILLALQVNQWNANSNDRKAEIKIYENIKRQILDDKETLGGVIIYNDRYYIESQTIIEIINQSHWVLTDSLGKLLPGLFKYSDFNRSGNVYQNLINGNQVHLLSNQSILDNLQNLEEIFIYINRLEETHSKVILEYVGPTIIGNIDLQVNKIVNQEILNNLEFKNLVLILQNIISEKSELYQQANTEIDDISALIDLEVIR